MFAAQWSVLCMVRGLDAVFYEFSGIIIRGFLTHVRTNSGDIFTVIFSRVRGLDAVSYEFTG